jgi:hypothetical protein
VYIFDTVEVSTPANIAARDDNLLEETKLILLKYAQTVTSAMSASVINKVQWPGSIKVTGLPFLLQGWNNIFVAKYSEKNSDIPEYVLQPYTLYNVIDIFGVTIAWNEEKEKWQFTRDCDYSPLFYSRKATPSTGFGAREALTAKWSDLTVTTDCTERNLMISISTHTGCAILVLFIVYLAYTDFFKR